MIKKFGPLVIISILIIGFWVSDFQNYLKIETLLASKSDLLNYINHHYFTSLLIFAVIYIAIVALSLPFASFMTLSAGLLFGWVAGTSIVVFAATMGATIIFLIAKSSFGDILKVRAGKLYKKIQKNMKDNATSYLLFLRLVPIFPFFLVNIVPAFFNIKTKTYIWTTAIGVLPATAIYVNVGRSLGEIKDPSDLVSGDIILSFVLLGMIALIPTIFKSIKTRGNTNVES